MSNPNVKNQDNSNLASPPSISKKKIMALVVMGVIIFALFGYYRWQQTHQAQLPSQSIENEPTTVPVVDAVAIRFVGQEELLPLEPIEQNLYRTAIQAAWEETLSKSPQSMARFPNDANMIGLQLQRDPQAEPKTFVIYTNKPIIVETEQVNSLPNNQTSSIELDQESNQLLIKFKHLPQVTALDLPQVLSESFNTIVNSKRLPNDVKNNPLRILAFETLL